MVKGRRRRRGHLGGHEHGCTLAAAAIRMLREQWNNLWGAGDVGVDIHVYSWERGRGCQQSARRMPPPPCDVHYGSSYGGCLGGFPSLLYLKRESEAEAVSMCTDSAGHCVVRVFKR